MISALLSDFLRLPKEPRPPGTQSWGGAADRGDRQPAASLGAWPGSDSQQARPWWPRLAALPSHAHSSKASRLPCDSSGSVGLTARASEVERRAWVTAPVTSGGPSLVPRRLPTSSTDPRSGCYPLWSPSRWPREEVSRSGTAIYQLWASVSRWWCNRSVLSLATRGTTGSHLPLGTETEPPVNHGVTRAGLQGLGILVSQGRMASSTASIGTDDSGWPVDARHSGEDGRGDILGSRGGSDRRGDKDAAGGT